MVAGFCFQFIGFHIASEIDNYGNPAIVLLFVAISGISSLLALKGTVGLSRHEIGDPKYKYSEYSIAASFILTSVMLIVLVTNGFQSYKHDQEVAAGRKAAAQEFMAFVRQHCVKGTIILYAKDPQFRREAPRYKCDTQPPANWIVGGGEAGDSTIILYDNDPSFKPLSR